jgi:hypothetical protein
MNTVRRELNGSPELFNPLCWLGMETFLTLVGAGSSDASDRFPIASFLC